MRKVFINGCFDILHRGHIELFKKAYSMGDFVMVAIDSDSRVRSMKGETRPVNNQEDRKFLLESIRFINEVCIFDSSEELENEIKFYKPDIMIVGSDYKNKNVIGSQYAKELHFFERINEYSTTKTIKNINDR